MTFRVAVVLKTAKHIGYLLITLIALSVAASAQQNKSGKITAKVDIESGAGGTSGVIFKLFRVQSSCCDPCKKPPAKPCRKCGCILGAPPVTSVTLMRGGSLKFDALPAGTYLIVNEVDGKNAGYEKFIEVQANKKADLGGLLIDTGQPPKNRLYHKPPVEP